MYSLKGVEVEDIQEVDTKETQEGTKYKIRVKDAALVPAMFAMLLVLRSLNYALTPTSHL